MLTFSTNTRSTSLSLRLTRNTHAPFCPLHHCSLRIRCILSGVSTRSGSSFSPPLLVTMAMTSPCTTDCGPVKRKSSANRGVDLHTAREGRIFPALSLRPSPPRVRCALVLSSSSSLLLFSSVSCKHARDRAPASRTVRQPDRSKGKDFTA